VATVEEDDGGEGRIGPPDGGHMTGSATRGEPDPGQQGGESDYKD